MAEHFAASGWRKICDKERSFLMQKIKKNTSKYSVRWNRVVCMLLAAAVITGIFSFGTSAKSLSSGVLVSNRKLSVNVGFYITGRPGTGLKTSQIRKVLKAVKKFSNTVRFYGAAGELEPAYKIAHDMKLTVVGTAWLSRDSAANKKEMNALIRHCNKGYCSVACVGSETLMRGDLTESELIRDIKYVRKRLKKKSILVTTADDSTRLLGSPNVCAACDVLMINVYPYWGGAEVSNALEAFTASVDTVRTAYPKKKLIISETGWPTAGKTVGQAKAGGTCAARYFTDIRKWSVAEKIPVLWFDAADEPWKKSSEGETGAHWGLMTKDCRLKACYKKLSFFKRLGY